MWATPDRNNNNNHNSSSNSNNNNNNSCIVYSCTSSPSKSSSSTSSSPAASPTIPNSLTRRSMEEVWKDISLPSLNDHPAGSTVISTSGNNPTFPSMTFQDFLASKEPAPRRSGVLSNGATSLGEEETTLFGSLAATPGTVLSLNSGFNSQYLESNGDPVRSNQAVLNGHSVFPSICKKRVHENNENSVDRRHKRMMKNRESAARSRARKQAYTNELENKLALLKKENSKLRGQEAKLLAAPTQLPKKNGLSRALTAPF